MKINKSDITKMQLEMLDVVMQMMKHKPESVPLMAVYYNDQLQTLDIVPIGNVTDKEIKMFAEAILNPDKCILERIIFKDEPPLN